MKTLKYLPPLDVCLYTAKWLVLCCAVAALAGTASAVFLFALAWAGQTHAKHPWLLFLLPAAGFAVAWVYLQWGKSVEAGNNLLLNEIHLPTQRIPLRMAPLILISTLVSHLFGASVGREGTAVQMGGALADQLTPLFKLQAEDRKTLLMAGISAGFASVFGTPLAGAVFALEVLAVGQLQQRSFLACVLAAFLADRVGIAWGVQHSHYSMGQIPAFGLQTLLTVLLAACLFGVAARLFATGNHQLSHWLKQKIAYAPMRPLLGGVVIAAAATALGTERYLGLGLNTLSAAFEHTLAPYDFAGKMAFTIASLGSGFKGGEVTPLFYIGATLGNALAPLLHLPVAFLAGLGFVAVFAGAANTPIACTFMAVELFGVEAGGYAAAACAVSTLFSGKTGIYSSQR